MEKVQQRTLGYYSGRVNLPCNISYTWSSENGGASGKAQLTFSLSEMQVRGESYLSKNEQPVVVDLNLTASTRARNKRWLKGKTNRQGLIIVDQLIGSGKIVLDEL